MPIFENWRHLCVDMQRIFAEDTPWHVDWNEWRLAARGRTGGTVSRENHLHALHSNSSRRRHVRHLAGVSLQMVDAYPKAMPAAKADLIPSLARLVPPARTFDKRTYSPWIEGGLQSLCEERLGTLVVTGGETEVCVLAAVLGAIDLGYHVVLPSDAIDSGADETHDAALKLLGNRFSVQLEFSTTERFLSSA